MYRCTHSMSLSTCFRHSSAAENDGDGICIDCSGHFGTVITWKQMKPSHKIIMGEAITDGINTGGAITDEIITGGAITDGIITGGAITDGISTGEAITARFFPITPNTCTKHIFAIAHFASISTQHNPFAISLTHRPIRPWRPSAPSLPNKMATVDRWVWLGDYIEICSHCLLHLAGGRQGCHQTAVLCPSVPLSVFSPLSSQ